MTYPATAIPRFQDPDYFDPEAHICEGCEAEIEECIADETDFCEDCLCEFDGENEDSCEGCIYCLCCSDYDERKANGTLKVD